MSGFDPSRAAMLEIRRIVRDEIDQYWQRIDRVDRLSRGETIHSSPPVGFDPSREALTLIADPFTLPQPTNQFARKWHCQHEEMLAAAAEVARSALHRGPRTASGIEAATADETRSGSAEGESPAPAGGDAQPSPSSSSEQSK